MLLCFKPVWQGYLFMKKIAAVGIAGIEWLWRVVFLHQQRGLLHVRSGRIWRGWPQILVHVWCCPWAPFAGLQPWSSLTLGNHGKDKKWLYWDNGFARSGFEHSFRPHRFVPSLLPHPSRLAVSTRRALPAPNCVTQQSSYLPPSPYFLFSPLFFPPAQLPGPICSADGARCVWGRPGWGRDSPKGTEDFLCLWVDVWSTGYLFHLPLDLAFLVYVLSNNWKDWH